jgi:UDP-N-acetylglucosamine--N-acetylmuramyl-(pentapeptide) pyrophosphoryl-undecaprenol N-acetylglucosamine transferase
VFSMGGYVAAPPMIAAILARVPVVVMEPNAHAGFTSRRLGRYARQALITFEETARYFPRHEVTGLPVRPEFFAIAPKPRGAVLQVLVTGGSRGARRLNQAVREAAPLLRSLPVKIKLQGGADLQPIDGVETTAFIDDMPAAFAHADLVIARSGAGALAELAAAGKPSILVPFPHAADDHQTKNAQAMARTGAARLVPDAEFTGERLAQEIRSALESPETLEKMARQARLLACPGAAARAASVLEEVAGLTPRHKAETIIGTNVF